MNDYNDVFNILGGDLKNIYNNLKNFLNTGENRKKFLSGLQDGDILDDQTFIVRKKIKVLNLKPSQDTIYLSKALSPIITWEKLRNEILNLLIDAPDIFFSSDGYIIDGHHRWASSIALRSNSSIYGTEINLPIKVAIPVLNAILISIRKFKSSSGTGKSIFSGVSADEIQLQFEKIADKETITDEGISVSATPKELFDISRYNNPKFITPGNKTLDGIYSLIYPKNKLLATKFILNNIKKMNKPASFFPDRAQMPQFSDDKAKKLSLNILRKGVSDIRTPANQYENLNNILKESELVFNKEKEIWINFKKIINHGK